MRGILKSQPCAGGEYSESIPVPKPGDRDVLVRVRASAICGTDIHIYNWSEYASARLKLPMVFGHEFSGDITEVGSKVTEYHVGDRIACETHIPCNGCPQCKSNNRHICDNMKIIGVHTEGAFAEYAVIPADCVYKLEDDISYEHAALLEPMGVAVHGISEGNVSGKTVVINGCGPIGLMAVGAAKFFGAKRIIVTDIVPAKLDLAKVLGADAAIDSMKCDAVGAIRDMTKGAMADVVFDYTGSGAAINAGFDMLKKGGRFVMVGLPSRKIEFDFAEKLIYKEATVVGVTGRRMYETWEECDRILKAGALDLDLLIGGRFAFGDFEQAFQLLREGCTGRVLLMP